MTEINYLTQTQLAERWQVAEGTLERWRSEGIGPIYMKMMGRVRYRLCDVTEFEEGALRGSTSQRASSRNDFFLYRLRQRLASVEREVAQPDPMDRMKRLHPIRQIP